MSTEGNPSLNEKNRRTIAANFMRTLCKKDTYARQNYLEGWFTIHELWEDLRGFD
jgi:hypothetical protein